MQICQVVIFAADLFQRIDPRLVRLRLPAGKIISHLMPANFFDDWSNPSFHTDIVSQENKKRPPTEGRFSTSNHQTYLPDV
jgi:hypothetical protein